MVLSNQSTLLTPDYREKVYTVFHLAHVVAKSASEAANFLGGFSMVKIRFLKKVLKNGLVSEKNFFIFFHKGVDRGAGQDLIWNFP